MNEQAVEVNPGTELDADLDEAYGRIQADYPGLDWDGDVGQAVSDALQTGFQLGRDYANSYPD